MKHLNVETLVGQTVIAGVVALAIVNVGATSFSGLVPSRPYTLVARFDDIGGLALHAPVRSAGVSVGRVVSVTLDSKRHGSAVTLEIDSDIRFPSDSMARILNAGLLGEQYVSIDRGADVRRLNPGDALARTQSALVLEHVIERFVSRGAVERVDARPAVAHGVPVRMPVLTVVASVEAGRR